MKFSVGDRVILKRTGDEGYVASVIDKQMIEVDVGGTVFPVYIDDVDHPYLKWFTEKRVHAGRKTAPEQLPVEQPKLRQQRLTRGVYLSFLPEFKTVEMEEMVSQVKVFLLNELPTDVKLNYDVRTPKTAIFNYSGTIHAFSNIYLHSIEYEVMNDQPRFQWKLADKDNTDHIIEEGIVKIKPAKLFGYISDIMNGGEPSFSNMLIASFRDKSELPPEPELKPVIRANKIQSISREVEDTPKYEVDLHIEQLVSSKRGLTNSEIIMIQLDTLRKYLQLAINHRQEYMVVIHGLGKGKLREEVHAILKSTPEVARFKNEWSGKYGFGATEVVFRI